MIEVYSPDAPPWLTFLRIFCKVLFFGPPPGKRSMFVPSGWPSCFVRHIGDFTADKWLTESFEDEESCTTIQRVDNIRVSRVAHYKTVQGLWQHEFIVVTLINRARGKYAQSEPLYLHYDRSSDEVDEEKKKHIARLKASRASSILSDQPVRRQDDLVPWSQTDVDQLGRDLKKGKKVLLKDMTFPSDPTILDLAAVLEAHSTLSPKYRLFATMCYWYAGSTYEVLERIHEGRSQDAKHARKSGKLGPITGYRAVREKQDAGDMGSLVESVKKQLLADKDNPVPEEELEQVAREELDRIPKFETLLQRSIERRAEVMAVLERRESERIRVETQGQRLEAISRMREEDQAEIKRLREEHGQRNVEVKRLREEHDKKRTMLEEDQAEIKKLREQVKTLELSKPSSSQ